MSMRDLLGCILFRFQIPLRLLFAAKSVEVSVPPTRPIGLLRRSNVLGQQPVETLERDESLL